MAKRQGGMPDSVFRPTASTTPKPERVEKPNEERRTPAERKTPMKADDTAKEAKWGRVPRQTYYVPSDIHNRLKAIAALNDQDVSELVVEGIQMALRKYQPMAIKKIGAEGPEHA